MTDVHIDLTALLIVPIVALWFVGIWSWETTVIALLAVGLPYGGPP